MNLEKPLKISGLGRRKTAIATILLEPNLNKEEKAFFLVNGRLGEEYFQYNFNYLHQIEGPFRTLALVEEYKLIAKVKGGGLTAQAEAIQLALARALANLNKEGFRSLLKKEGYLSRDARIKERRKYGLKKARKASQSSKR